MKDFDSWNSLKKKIDTTEETRFYHPRDVWWCSIGIKIGYEQDGKDIKYQRPILVLKKFGNIALIVPLTSSPRKHKYRIDIGVIDGKPAKAIISQIKVVDTKRFTEKISVLGKEAFAQVTKNIRSMF